MKTDSDLMKEIKGRKDGKLGEENDKLSKANAEKVRSKQNGKSLRGEGKGYHVEGWRPVVDWGKISKTGGGKSYNAKGRAKELFDD